MLKKTFLLVFLILLGMLVTYTQPVRASTLYVESTPGACGGLTPTYPDVSSAISAAVDGDVIVICESLTENVNMLSINKRLTITGLYGGSINTLELVDTSSFNPTISMSTKVVFRDIKLVVRSSTLTPPPRYIEIVSGEFTMENSELVSYTQFSFAVTSVIYAYQSSINFTNSLVDINYYQPTSVRSYFINVRNSNVNIENSQLISNGSGYLLYIYFSTAFPIAGDYSFTLSNSNLTSPNGGGIDLFVGENNRLNMLIKSSIIDVKHDAMKLSTQRSSIVNIVSESSSFISDFNSLFFNLGWGSYLDFELNASNVAGGVHGLYILSTASIISGTIDNSKVVGKNGNTLHLACNFNTMANLEIKGSELDSEGAGYVLRLPITSSFVDLNIEHSELTNDLQSRASRSGLYATLYSVSRLRLTINGTNISSRSTALGIASYSMSGSEVSIEKSYLHSEDNLELSISANHVSYSTINVGYSYIGEFALQGTGTIRMRLNETVYSELGSYTDRFQVYSQWTLKVYVLSKQTKYPIQGATVRVSNDTSVISEEVTDNHGAALIRLSYIYSSANPVIDGLNISASFKSIENETSYTDFEDELTLPYWYGDVTITLDYFAFKATLAGHIGYGVLTFSGNNGRLAMGGKTGDGWINYYSVSLVKHNGVGSFLVVSIKVLYNNVWVNGHMLVNVKSKLVYVKFGGIELYGSYG